jgi:hypothetical protein
VAREWPGAEGVVEQGEVSPEPVSVGSGSIAGEKTRPGSSTRKAPPLSDRDLRSWYQQRVFELTTRGETASGEMDWEASKQQFAGRVTRARVRALREEFVPADWKQQGRRSPSIGK